MEVMHSVQKKFDLFPMNLFHRDLLLDRTPNHGSDELLGGGHVFTSSWVTLINSDRTNRRDESIQLSSDIGKALLFVLDHLAKHL